MLAVSSMERVNMGGSADVDFGNLLFEGEHRKELR